MVFSHTAVLLQDLSTSKVDSDFFGKPGGMAQLPQLLLSLLEGLPFLLGEPLVGVRSKIIRFIVNDLGSTHTGKKQMRWQISTAGQACSAACPKASLLPAPSCSLQRAGLSGTQRRDIRTGHISGAHSCFSEREHQSPKLRCW